MKLESQDSKENSLHAPSRRAFITGLSGAIAGLLSEAPAQVIILISDTRKTRETIGKVPATIHDISTNLDGVLPAWAYYIPAHATGIACAKDLKKIFQTDPVLLAWIGEIIHLEKWAFLDEESRFIIISWDRTCLEGITGDNPFLGKIGCANALAYNSSNARQYLPIRLRLCFMWPTPGIVINYPMHDRDVVMSAWNILRNELIERLLAARCRNSSLEWYEDKLSVPLIQVSTYLIDAFFAKELHQWKDEKYEKKMNHLRDVYQKNPDEFLKRLRQSFEKASTTFERIIQSYHEDALEYKTPNSLINPAERKILEQTLRDHLVSYIPIDPKTITFEEAPFSVEIDGKKETTTYLIPKF